MLEIEKSDDYKKLLKAVESDEKNSPNFHNYRGKLQWVIDRAKRYAEKTGLNAVEREEKHLKKFKISYYYLATGMEGRPDLYPEKIIEAQSKDKAVYIYHVMFFDSYNDITYQTFLNKEEYEKYWGISVSELVDG